MNDQSLEQLLKYSDKYIAYVDEYLNIIASGKSIGDVENQLKDKGVKDATITYIPPVNKTFTPVCQ
jgi:hypothetical protein